jgi:hypothetical protein
LSMSSLICDVANKMEACRVDTARFNTATGP